MQKIIVGTKIFYLERKATIDREKIDYTILQEIPLIMQGVISVQDSKKLQTELTKYKEEGILVLSRVDALLICSTSFYTKELFERLE